MDREIDEWAPGFEKFFFFFFSNSDDWRRYTSNTEGILLIPFNLVMPANWITFHSLRDEVRTYHKRFFFSGSQELVILSIKRRKTWSSWIYFMVGPRLLFQNIYVLWTLIRDLALQGLFSLLPRYCPEDMRFYAKMTAWFLGAEWSPACAPNFCMQKNKCTCSLLVTLYFLLDNIFIILFPTLTMMFMMFMDLFL